MVARHCHGFVATTVVIARSAHYALTRARVRSLRATTSGMVSVSMIGRFRINTRACALILASTVRSFLLVRDGVLIASTDGLRDGIMVMGDPCVSFSSSVLSPIMVFATRSVGAYESHS